MKEDGNLSDATVFSAFAANDETNASVHVELNRAKKGFNIYGNGFDLTQKYNQITENDDPVLPVPGGTLLVSKRGETLVVLFPSSGISLNISVTVEMLSLSTIVPKKFQNVTIGLLGNYNGKPEDDFTLPNGTLLPSNLTERDVFSYGQNWAINGEHSAFMYPDGKNNSDFHNTTYVPRFLDEADKDKLLEAEKACNGSENIECVFDYVFTERQEIAEATNMLKGDAEKTKNEMDEVVPSLGGCKNIKSTVKQMVFCPLKIDDGSSVNFLANTVNASFNETLSGISYYQDNDDPVDIRVVAKNSKGRSSPVFIVVVLLCTGCNGRGICTDIPRDDPRNTEHFKYATCECDPEYEGPDCENEFDGCAEDPCSLGRNCTSLKATEQKEMNRTYLCDACPDGFMSNDDYHDTCFDIDECDRNNACNHICFNTEGSYECMCNAGYRVDTRDSDKCLDINECEDLNTPHNCSQSCTNIEGSFMCSCYNGYVFESGNCTLNETTDNPCSKTNCSQTAGCLINDDNDPECFCNNGFELDGETSCTDINECERNACPQYCSDFDGGFSCSCFTGFKLVGSTTCQECDVGTWGENCQNECQCTGEGVKSCDPVKGCICEDGWQGETCDEDINECNTTIDVCDDPRKVCHNTPGSFMCKCRDGFMETIDGVCKDIDECTVPSLHTCDQICKNSIGGYSCECDTGYISGESACDNIDECTLRIHDCEQVCDDNPGSYNCYCYFGYTLNDDRRTCTKLSDPCLTLHGLNCSHYCFISTDHAECRCQDGYVLGSDDQTCTDIDECTNGQHTCETNAECKNTGGSYSCDCPIGSKLENDGRTCSDCDEFHYGKDCAFNCSCIYGYCNRTEGCLCDSGWRGNTCDIDLDECDTGQLMCTKPNEMCINTLGSAICECTNGYIKNETDHCIDIDECSDSKLNTCDQKCENTPGSYLCDCQQGFLYTDGSCNDIDECKNKKSECEQLCENTLGSYRCYCEDGFKLNQTDRVSCTPAYGCSNSSACGNNSSCFNSNGVESCRCVNGFENQSGLCKDIDECKLSPRPCSQNCTNNEGGYLCSCNKGYYLTKDVTTCKECETGTFGDNCTQNCTCSVQNSDTCDHINGSCTCKEGWNGTTCDTDIDECKNTTLCPKHSTCNNTDGGYDCICVVGYFKTSSGLCIVCDDTHYGENCAMECPCVRSNTASCNHTNGHCECIEGWEGNTCSLDVVECDEDSICTEHATCENTQGSYKCICDNGFSEIEDKCIDIDECLMNHKCIPHKCVNTPGNYTCKCRKGYQGVWDDCAECSDHTYGENCSRTCDCHPANTVKVDDKRLCDSVNGSCKCLPNWKGDACEVDVDECEDERICDQKLNSGCVNTDGWYNCDCYRGFIQDGIQCVTDNESTTTPLPDAAINLKFSLHIVYIELDTVDLNVTATYDYYHDQAMRDLKFYYKQFTTVDLDIWITDIRRGGLIIDYVVQYKDNDVGVAVALVEATKKLDEFKFDGEKYKVTIKSESFNDTDGICNILQSIGTCSLVDCVEEDGIAKCNSGTNELNTPQIVGIAVGCGLFVFIIAIVIIVCVSRRRNSKKQTRKQAAFGRSLPDVPNDKQLGVDKTRPWQDSSDQRYLTWKTMLSASPPDKQDENVYDEPYKIPRAHVGQPTKHAAKDTMYF